MGDNITYNIQTSKIYLICALVLVIFSQRIYKKKKTFKGVHSAPKCIHIFQCNKGLNTVINFNYIIPTIPKLFLSLFPSN